MAPCSPPAKKSRTPDTMKLACACAVILLCLVAGAVAKFSFAEVRKCFQDASLSDAGKAKIKEMMRGGASKGVMPSPEQFKEKLQELKAALESTDQGKLEALSTCLSALKPSTR